MPVSQVIKKAKSIVNGFPLDFLSKNSLKIDRVHDNPEAGRYFLMFAEWEKVSPEEIFSSLNRETAQHTQIYIDFVFCNTLCDFCAFYGVVPKNIQEIDTYVQCLKKEIKVLKQIFFDQGFYADALEYGGGTPTLLPLDLLRDITECVHGEFPFLENHEFNFEASPETLTGQEGIDKLRYLKSAGANRMSIGVQSFEENVLANTNRPHNLKDVHEAIVNSQKVGFDRINVDLMLGLNGQTMSGFLDSVQKTIDYGIDIIELYTLRYFDTKEFILAKKKLNNTDGFWGMLDILVARVAADLLLHEAGYLSRNGRTYERKNSRHHFYAAYYDGNFTGKNTLGIGRKSNSNMYPWQYANYRNLEKYQNAVRGGKLPIAAGVRFSSDQHAAKLLSGMFQLGEEVDYGSMRNMFSKDARGALDQCFDKFIRFGLLEKAGRAYKKTLLGFLLIEEMLKQIYDVVVKPYSSASLFLGKKQAD